MSNYKVVNVSTEAAMKAPRQEHYRNDGVTAYMCLVPQTRETAHEVHFVSDSEGYEWGQFDNAQQSIDRAAMIVREKRKLIEESPSP